jgi:hypothetical protein
MKEILEQALLAPLEMKDLILSKIYHLDKKISNELFNETNNIIDVNEYNKIITKYLAEQN